MVSDRVAPPVPARLPRLTAFSLSVFQVTTSPESDAPEIFRQAVDAMAEAQVRTEISLGPIRPPQRLAAYSYALGLEVVPPDTDDVPEFSDGDAFGRLILLHDPAGDSAWQGTLRLVAYIQADVEAAMASDPFLPQVAWSWLTDALDRTRSGYTALGGTVTCTSSVRYGEISGPPQSHQLELRASWTPHSADLTDHVEALAAVLAEAAGMLPEGVSQVSVSRFGKPRN